MKKSTSINIFDFDGTLTTETWLKFWVWVKKFGYTGEKRNDSLEKSISEYRNTHEGNELETFFGFFNDLLENNGESLTFDELMEGERYIEYNRGLADFLENTTAKNYIISGGLKEFLDNLEVADHFEAIYGTPIKLDENNKMIGIGEVMTDDKKIMAIREILKVNDIEDDDCSNVYYIGDGYSDAPAMKFVHDNGGKAIFVHQPTRDDALREHNDKIYEKLNETGIIDYMCLADYSNGSKLSNILLRKDGTH